MNKDKIQILVMGTAMKLAVLVVATVLGASLYDETGATEEAKDSKKII